MKKIVFIGFWDWAPVLIFSRSCRALGISVYLVEVTEKTASRHPHFSCFAGDRTVLTWDAIVSPQGPAIVRACIDKIGADAVISTDEFLLNWLAQNRASFEPSCRVMAGPAETHEMLLSKVRQSSLAREAGFNVLETWYLSNIDDIVTGPHAGSYPICVRPTYPASVEPKFKAKLLSSPADLRKFLESLKSIGRPLIAQPFHIGPNLVVHGARDSQGNILALDGFLAYRKFRGYALSLERTKLSADLVNCCERFATSIGIVGVFHFDLLRSDSSGLTYFLEINPRMGGTTSKVFPLGYDEPALVLRSHGFCTLAKDTVTRAARRATGKRNLILHIIACLRNETQEFSYPMESRWTSIGRSIFELAFLPDPVLSAKEPWNSLWYILHRGTP
jgi:hypothetical protein